MSDWLLDTNVVCELSRPRPEPRVIAFLEKWSTLSLSVITLHELEYAVSMATPPRREKLRTWLEELEEAFDGRIFEVNASIARSAAGLRAAEARAGRVLSPLDSLIAATALFSGMGLATRNTIDFEHLGVTLVDPWAPA